MTSGTRAAPALVELESEVRSYSRIWPTVFSTARGHVLEDKAGRRYLDFFTGAGALNYGHNDPRLKRALIEYLERDGVMHSLDTWTEAREAFVEALHERVLRPRELEHRVQFTGPTGANAVEAALKAARLATGRSTVVAFTDAYHGHSLGALAATGGRKYRAGAGLPLGGVFFAPYDGYAGVDSLALLERYLTDELSGLDPPAAILVESVQAEGGVNVPSPHWLRRLAVLARAHGALLVADEIQTGCGRTGPFFAFERAEIVPDVVCLSKSLSAFGLPLSAILLRPEVDVWLPGQHTGTFRGFNAAFVTGAEALDTFWSDDALERETQRKGELLLEAASALREDHDGLVRDVRGAGLMVGIELADGETAARLVERAFEDGLLLEACGPQGRVLKLLPPLTTPDGALLEAIEIVERGLTSERGSTA